eukprot:26405-Pelagococcus_subviridis.AAC.5
MRVFAAVTADAVLIRDVTRAPRALQNLLRPRVEVHVERGELDDAPGENERRREVHDRLRRARSDRRRGDFFPRRSIRPEPRNLGGDGCRAVNREPSDLDRPPRVVNVHDHGLHERAVQQLRDDRALGESHLRARGVDLRSSKRLRRGVVGVAAGAAQTRPRQSRRGL